MPPLPNSPVSRRELLESGVPARRIEAMRRSGELRTVFRGVYVSGEAADSLASRAAAASLVLGPDQVVCDRAAAYLHGVDAYGAREAHARPLETCVVRGGVRTRRAGVDGRERDLAPRDVERRHNVRVTTPLRTALDLGCALPRHRALGVMDQLARLYEIDPLVIRAECRRFRRRRGVVQLRELAELVDPRSESPRESWLRLTVHDAGLPAPDLQWSIIEDGIEIWRLDLAYPSHKVAVEYDGEEFHRRTRTQISRDRERRRWLCEHGWTVIVVTKEDLTSPEWVDALREALASQTHRFRWELGRGYN